MKNNLKTLYKLISFTFLVLLLFFLKNGTLKADVIVFEYTTGPIPNTYSGFKTQLECENNRTLFTQKNPGSTSTMCRPVTIAGEPIITNEYVPFTPQTNTDEEIDPNTYKLLAPIGDFEEITTNNIGDYFNKFFLLAIGLAAALAVIMLIIGGVQWMGTDSVFGKTEAKKQITSAILGLLIAIGSYALLNTINPDLLGKRGLSVNQVSVEIEGDANIPTYISIPNLTNLGIKCDKLGYSSLPAVARSFNTKMTYSQDIPKGQLGPNNTVKYDCSGFVNAVLQCSGVNTNSLGINSGTATIFNISKAEAVNKNTITPTSINGTPLKVGDLIGWKPSDDKNNNGHVMIYIGNGMVADSHGPRNKTGQAYGEFSLETYKDRITTIVRTQSL